MYDLKCLDTDHADNSTGRCCIFHV
uniref:Uncharacterized protein n=1 Tax=Anguilla anguilla TaxID=7936 RepID=A0A0E9QD65_ANGAN